MLIIAIMTIIALTILHRINSKRHSNTSDENTGSLASKLRQRSHFEARTMKTIIGRYVGARPIWAQGTVDDKLLNTNNYDPDPNAGHDGRPVYLPGYPKAEMQALYTINRFNLVVSDKISVDRKLPDPRKLACRKRHYDEAELATLPNTSIIIVFHNEAWSTLARTVHSILNTAPQHLVAEILLVDDASNRTFLGKSLEYYMNNLASVRGVDIHVLRSKERIGLIRARLLGVDKARGKVLTFIDAHCEATNGWLEPLLEQIKLEPKTAACPIIDIINEDTFAFTRSFELHLGAFNWGLNFRWYPISRRELIDSNGQKAAARRRTKQQQAAKLLEIVHPFHTPVMAGGLFSIDKAYFEHIGRYDSHMDIWGGENIELSLRLWQCGGQVKIVPCSHVGHIFRKSSPYTFREGKDVGDILYTNLARVAEVWMDEWRDFFYRANPVANRTVTKVGRSDALRDIDERKRLRQQLQCENFEWFLDNVWPEHFFPKHDRFFGRLQLFDEHRCLQRPTVRIGMGQAAVGAVETSNCSEAAITRRHFVSDQMFVFNNKTGFLMTDENICLDSGSDPIATRQVILAPCSESKRQKWRYSQGADEAHHFIHAESGLCLDSPTTRRVQLENCNAQKATIKWRLVEQRWH